MREKTKKTETESFTHSVMFHHFHSDQHDPAQGSLDANDFEDMLDWLSNKYCLNDADKYIEKYENNKLNDEDICLSFDDALLCQFDIAVPILKKRNIKAFFFVYSSAFTKTPDMLEIFRLFRTSHFDNIDEFYGLFFEAIEGLDKSLFASESSKFKDIDYLSADPFYSYNDRWFRYLRDQVLSIESYNNIMYKMIQRAGFDILDASKKLWMTEDNVRSLYSDGHIIGLHSFSHPMQMSKLPRQEQEKEYKKNLDHLESILGKNTISSMSHPCGDYNDVTLNVLGKLNIKIGFRSTPSLRTIKSSLEIPRNSHSNVFKDMMK